MIPVIKSSKVKNYILMILDEYDNNAQDLFVLRRTIQNS